MAENNNNRPLEEGFNGGKVSTDLLLMLLAAVFSGDKTNVSLEKEVSYLAGKVNTLEDFILKNK